MEDRIADLLSFCSRIDFGAVDLSREEEEFPWGAEPGNPVIL